MIVFYSVSCEGCSGNQALSKMQTYCKKRGVDFEERRTILWERYEQEANEIMEAYNVKMPFFYATNSGIALEGNTLTPLDEIQKLIEKEQNASEQKGI